MVVRNWLDDLFERLDRIETHVYMKRVKLAEGMLERTFQPYNELAEVIRRRGSSYLETEIGKAKVRIGQVANALVMAMTGRR